jgi:hypothetical protein
MHLVCFSVVGSAFLDSTCEPGRPSFGVEEEIEMTPELLAELKDKARQRGLSLFAYLAHFVSQDNEDIRRKGPRFE